jgi:TonB family protein
MNKSFALLVSMIIAFGGVVLAQNVNLTITSKPRASYTNDARTNTTVGEVTLSVQFLKDGTIGEIQVLSALPDGLVEQAIAAARRIKFEPKRVNGVAVSVTKTMEYGFDIILPEADSDITRKVKILKNPLFQFDPSEEKELGGRKYKISVYFSRTGVASLNEVKPSVSKHLLDKFKQAVKGIVFEPAVHRNGKKITVIKAFDFR